jgi:hypothetical protein
MVTAGVCRTRYVAFLFVSTLSWFPKKQNVVRSIEGQQYHRGNID